VILALSAMDATVQGIFYLIAVILFVIAALLVYAPAREGRRVVDLVALGLAFAFFPAMWNSFAAA
jgi:hypothetical protein